MIRIRTTSSRRWGAAACALALSCSFAAQARAADAEPQRADAPDALGSHQRNVRLDIGLRTQFLKGAGYDPFSGNDVLHHFSTSASLAFWSHERLSLAGVAGFDYGMSSARARSSEASLDVRRFVLAPEARYHVLRVLALTARLGPTLTREEATLSAGLDTELSKTAWRFGLDATVGAAVELWGYASGASRKPRLWASGELGYGYTAPNQLNLKPRNESAAPQRAVPVDLGELSVGGPLFRITAGLSFW